MESSSITARGKQKAQQERAQKPLIDVLPLTDLHRRLITDRLKHEEKSLEQIVQRLLIEWTQGRVKL